MAAADFAHIDAWVFDLDNTLYAPEARLFDQIEQRMTEYVMRTAGVGRDAADRLRRDWWQRHGTTLAGLMALHDIDPEDYLVAVHDIRFDALVPDPELAARIAALPGRRIVYTNGSAPYARRVIEARGLAGVFDDVFGVEHAGYRPKPRREAYVAVLGTAGIAPATAAMFEDDARNLEAPHALGMRTVHVAPAPEPAPHIHHHTAHLPGFLGALVRA